MLYQTDCLGLRFRQGEEASDIGQEKQSMKRLETIEICEIDPRHYPKGVAGFESAHKWLVLKAPGDTCLGQVVSR